MPLRRLRVTDEDPDWPRGITSEAEFFQKMPLEFQSWVLVGVSIFGVTLMCLPCLCSSARNSVARLFMNWVYSRMHIFFTLVSCFNLLLVCFTVSKLPGWSFNEYLLAVVSVLIWVLDHLQKFLVSSVILLGLWLLWSFKERLALAVGVDHITLVRFSWKDLFTPWNQRYRALELFLWKAEEIPSGKLAALNDVFVEVHLGHNEVMRTRVHNHVGSFCVFKESIELNWDPADEQTRMIILIKDQGMVTSTEVARVELASEDIRYLLELTKGSNPESDMIWESPYFNDYSCKPRGQLSLRLQWAAQEEYAETVDPPLPRLFRDPRSVLC